VKHLFLSAFSIWQGDGVFFWVGGAEEGREGGREGGRY